MFGTSIAPSYVEIHVVPGFFRCKSVLAMPHGGPSRSRDVQNCLEIYGPNGIHDLNGVQHGVGPKDDHTNLDHGSPYGF